MSHDVDIWSNKRGSTPQLDADNLECSGRCWVPCSMLPSLPLGTSCWWVRRSLPPSACCSVYGTVQKSMKSCVVSPDGSAWTVNLDLRDLDTTNRADRVRLFASKVAAVGAVPLKDLRSNLALFGLSLFLLVYMVWTERMCLRSPLFAFALPFLELTRPVSYPCPCITTCVRRAHHQLAMTCTGPALGIAKAVERNHGVEVWRRLIQRDAPDAGPCLQNMMTRILQSRTSGKLQVAIGWKNLTKWRY